MSFKGAAAQVAARMQETPEGREQLAFAQLMTRRPDWAWLTDAFGQPFGGWKPGQLAYLFRLYQFWSTGQLAATRLPVGCDPYADAARLENQAALNALRLIEEPDYPGFSAEVDLDQQGVPAR